MNTPLPKKTVRGSSSGVAIMAAFDLLGTKWNMRILWELNSKPLNFRSLQNQCDGMSPSVLNNRIKQLSEARLIYTSDEGYKLTELGYSLMQTLDPLREWASAWEDALQQ
ncbi:helix-turn-helix transcriptional regulator [Vibrio fluvialis]|nr:helix-turn-helix transcriptional regulator [Vibrio fluvialis]